MFSSRTVKLIETQLARLERASEPNASAEPDASAGLDVVGMELLALHDEIRRQARKWRLQAEAGSTRRKPEDFGQVDVWLRRWRLAADGLLARGLPDDVAAAVRQQIDASATNA